MICFFTSVKFACLLYEEFAFSGTSRSKISAPPGFSAPARVPPPGFSTALPSQEFPSGISSHDGSIALPRFPWAFSSQISAQELSKPPSRLPSPFSSGFSSLDGPNSSSRFPSAFSSGFSSQNGPNPSSGFPFSSGFSSQDGSNQSYGSTNPGLFPVLISLSLSLSLSLSYFPRTTLISHAFCGALQKIFSGILFWVAVVIIINLSLEGTQVTWSSMILLY
jgi:hypothetical protein